MPECAVFQCIDVITVWAMYLCGATIAKLTTLNKTVAHAVQSDEFVKAWVTRTIDQQELTTKVITAEMWQLIVQRPLKYLQPAVFKGLQDIKTSLPLAGHRMAFSEYDYDLQCNVDVEGWKGTLSPGVSFASTVADHCWQVHGWLLPPDLLLFCTFYKTFGDYPAGIGWWGNDLIAVKQPRRPTAKPGTNDYNNVTRLEKTLRQSFFKETDHCYRFMFLGTLQPIGVGAYGAWLDCHKSSFLCRDKTGTPGSHWGHVLFQYYDGPGVCEWYLDQAFGCVVGHLADVEHRSADTTKWPGYTEGYGPHILTTSGPFAYQQ
eukprot:TRINITY_DN2886_c0_g1_i1.p2 TRINITY_DN2886_c0_g1~~TRINITY_DN2886_c0_g1_i1.p2  ORF type:complete len:318 (+),score=21.16 TRINITY_DN2886_c0_g1_i1:207-1160(+)